MSNPIPIALVATITRQLLAINRSKIPVLSTQLWKYASQPNILAISSACETTWVYTTTLPGLVWRIRSLTVSATTGIWIYRCGLAYWLSTTGRTTRYTILGRTVWAQNIDISLRQYHIRQNNTSLSVSGNMAINNTICVLAAINQPNYYIYSWKSAWLFNIIQHLLIIIQSSRCTIHSQLINIIKSWLNADSGVTNIIDALSGGRRLSYSIYKIPNWVY